tara:strand:+ start:3905 stop:7798 length:3894 start_codon:yes stop_codon:yes gene_type:complete
MATNSISGKATARTKSINFIDIVRAVIMPLASLKLTVFLLVLAVFITFVATLDQTRSDVYIVKMKHFDNLFVEVPFQTLFVPRWFPNQQNIPGSFYLPSGLSVLVLMLMNLTAAHTLRFRLQAKGKTLLIGLLATIFSAFLTWAIIFSGQGSEGLQNTPPLSWQQLWTLMQVGILLLGIGAIYACSTMGKERKIERILLGISSVALIAVFGGTMLLGEDAFIGDSAMRILWQLIQATVAALVAYAACIILFRRKAGIVLLHLGVAGLMLNEIYVTTTNEEQRMSIAEGQTMSHALDIRATEMAIIDVSDPEFDSIVSIPGKKLEKQELIVSKELPFDVKCLQYIPNSDITRINTSDPVSNAGIGLEWAATPIPTSTGTDTDQAVDFASAYVELFQDEKSLGTYLITQLRDASLDNSVTVGDKTYQIALRFKTEYKPYAITLIDAQRENYIGTQTPRFFGSEIELEDFESGVSSEQLIWMNNPLRYAGETFYQSSMSELGNGKQLSIFQVVKNKGWMIPYVCCMFSVVGLLAQFGNSLLSFLEKSRKSPQTTEDSTLAAEAAANVDNSGGLSSFTSGKRRWVIPLAFCLLMAGWTLKEGSSDSKNSVVEDMRLDRFGEIPITINGRVQPLDSFARNTARQLSKREAVADGRNQNQPAIRWLADNLFEADGFDQYRVFRIEDLTIINALSLPSTLTEPRARKFKYTLAELLAADSELRKLLPNPQARDEEWTVFQKRLRNVTDSLQQVYGLKLMLGPPSGRDPSDLSIVERLVRAGDELKSPLIPLVIPTTDEETPWASFLAAENQAWLCELSRELDCQTTTDLSKAIVKLEITPIIEPQIIRTTAISYLMQDPDFRNLLEKEYGTTDREQIARTLLDNWEALPISLREGIENREDPLVDSLVAENIARSENEIAGLLLKLNKGNTDIEQNEPLFHELLKELRQAYLAQDAETFNSTVEDYLAEIETAQPTGYSNRKFRIEKIYNSYPPFYFAAAIYLLAFITACFGWIGLHQLWNRVSTSLIIFGLGWQIFGLISRVMISGRPPVTNLYSSVLFVSMGMVILMLIVERITKLGIGNVVASLAALLALIWAWTMTIVDGDTFTVMVAVLDTQFWLSTHVICISLGYSATFAAGMLGFAYLIGLLVTPAFATVQRRRSFVNLIYGIVCFGLFCSFFGTVLGGLWGDDSWGRFWGWDPKENGALMIVLWNAVVLHARWGGLVKDRGIAALAVLGNVIVLWSWKGVNSMGVGLHAYAGTEDNTMQKIIMVGVAHVAVAALVFIPMKYWMSYAREAADKKILN